MRSVLFVGLLCCATAVLAGSEEQVAAQRTRGCVNSIPGICQIPIYALFSPYAERLYGERVVVKGYLRLMERIWVLYPDEGSARYGIAERGVLITTKDDGYFDEKYMSNKYMQIEGRFQLSSNAMFWAEIVLADRPQEAPLALDGSYEPAPPKPEM